MLGSLLSLLGTFAANYRKSTPSLLKIVDAFLIYQLLTAAVLFVYVVLVGTFPFNSFLSAFFSCIGSAVLTAAYRQQINPLNTFPGMTPERAFAELVVGSLVLHLVVMNFMG